MQEKWIVIEDFPAYSVSNLGQVCNRWSERMLSRSYQAYGVPNVWLVRDGVQHCRSVPLLVARAWLPDPERPDFTTPIQLNGDRSDCSAENLLWRPRHFAIYFHKEYANPPFPAWGPKHIRVVETGQVFRSPLEIAQTFGVLQSEVYLSILNGQSVFPHWWHYEYI